MMSDDTQDAPGLTLEQKAALVTGADFWLTKAIGPIPAVRFADGPHGLRVQSAEPDHLGVARSAPATCFPPAVALGASWDTALIERIGAALGVECAHAGVDVLLGPGINLKRSPLGGRNFEYFSEDPLHTGEAGAAWVRGLQSQGVGASLKHFAANNQETDRLRVSADIDPRALREIYLRGFQRVIQDAHPWTVMCSYNRLNGELVSQHPWLLTTVLRGEWKFDGVVVSDWGAVADRIAALRAGLDLEMPGTVRDAGIVAAVGRGDLDASYVDRSAARIVALAERAAQRPNVTAPLDHDAHHALAREAAARSIVLLKNDDALLPFAPGTRLAVIGAFAENPRYQGAGSSRVHPTRLDTALSELRARATVDIAYAPGFALDPVSDAHQRSLRAEAVVCADAADATVVFLGLPAHLESEGFDRTNLDLPAEQHALLDAVLAVNPRTVVVLSHGGVVALPFVDRVPGILDASLLGQGGGAATADILYGLINPSGKLTETIPHRIEDTPSFANFPGEHGHVRYGEGIFVGYRGYDNRNLDVAFPFGHGLTYTSFAYSDLHAHETPHGDIDVAVCVRNTGERDGREIVQIYTAPETSAVARPVRELKAFACVDLAAGESRTVTLTVRRADLAYWDVRVDAWVVEPAAYRIDAAASSRDIRLTTRVDIAGDDVRMPITADTTLGEIFASPAASALLRKMTARDGEPGLVESADAEVRCMLASFPIGRMGIFGLTDAVLDEFLAAAAGANLRV